MNVTAKFCLKICILMLASSTLVACKSAAKTAARIGTDIAISKTAEELMKPSAQTKAGASPVTNSADNKTYTNEFFQMTVQKPDGWYTQNKEESDAEQKQGIKMIAGNDKNMEAALAAAPETIRLFSFSEVPPGKPGVTNADISAVAEDVKASPGVKTGCDYITLMKEILKKSQLVYEFGEKCETKTVNGTAYGVVEAQMTIGNQTVKQRFYSTIRNRHAVAIIQTYFDGEGETKLNKIIETVKFGG